MASIMAIEKRNQRIKLQFDNNVVLMVEMFMLIINLYIFCAYKDTRFDCDYSEQMLDLRQIKKAELFVCFSLFVIALIFFV